MSDAHQYFATLPADDIPQALYSKIEDYFQELERTGQLFKIKKSFDFYYNLSNNADAVREGGEVGELLRISINHYKSILSQIFTIITKERPALKCQATNTDSKTIAEVRLGDDLLNYYLKTQDIEQVLKDAAEMALVLSGAYAVLRWDTDLGEEHKADLETGRVIYNGDISATAKSCLDVVCDLYAEREDWYILIEYRNKWDTATKFPELADEISHLGSNTTGFSLRDQWRLRSFSMQASDLIPHYTFVHRPTPSVPNGRQVEFLEGNIVLTDGPLPYRNLPIIPIRPGRIAGTQIGDTVAFSLLAIQELIDELHSCIATNQSTFGVTNILAPKGSDIDIEEFDGGLNLIKYDPAGGKPEALNLTNTPGEIFNYLQMLQTQLELLSGLNSVARGVAPPQLRSGSALALLASAAKESQSGLDYSYKKLMERTGTSIIHILQDYAESPRIAFISGKANGALVASYTQNDIAGISRVTVEQVSGLSASPAGKLEIAQNLLEGGMLKRPEEYLSVVATGSLNPLVEPDQAELLLIRQENEAMRDGEEMVVIDIDSHDLHIRSHREVLSNPQIRKNPAVVKLVLAHILEHLNALKQTDPALLSIIKEPVIPPSQPGPQPASPQSIVAPGEPGTDEANLPNLPTNPATGRPFDPAGGF